MPATGTADLTKLRADTVAQIELLITAIWQLLALLINPWPPADAPAAISLYIQTITGLLETIPGNIAVIFTGNFGNTHNLLLTLLDSVLGPLGATMGTDYTALLKGIFVAYDANLAASKTTDPGAVVPAITSALEEASTLAVGSRLITMFFELFLPKQLNFMNWLGPTLAQFAGYDEIVRLWRNPRLQAAIGNLAAYNANAEFLTVAPRAQEARSLLARRLISQTDATKIEGWGGTMTAYQAAQEAEAFRPVPPFLLARAAEAGAIPIATLTRLLQFAGFRDGDISTLETAYAALALAPYQAQYLSAAVRSTELGTMTPAELTEVLNDIALNQDQQALVQLTVATRKLEQLAELYRKSISEAYRYGQITDDQYVPALEAIGIGAADAQAHYAIDSIALRGRTALAAAKAESRLEASRTRAATQAAVAAYRTGTFDEAALSAALIAAGVDPEIAAFIVTVQTERRAGPLTFIYGREIGRAGALVLKEKVAAVENQYKKQLIDDAAAAAALVTLEIPTANANALLADWAALKTKPTTTGELLSR